MTGTVTVYSYVHHDGGVDRQAAQPYKRTRDAILNLGREHGARIDIIEDTAEEVEQDQLDDDGRYMPKV